MYISTLTTMKIKKKLMTFAAVICCSVTLYAQQLTEQEAMERAMQYMNRGKSFAQSRNNAAPANGGVMKLDAAPVEAEKIYAFNMEGGGYVIAAADSRTLPVLGARPWSRLSRPIGARKHPIGTKCLPTKDRKPNCEASSATRVAWLRPWRRS